MAGLLHHLWSGLVPACWSPQGCAWRGLVVVLALCWVLAGALAPGPVAPHAVSPLTWAPLDPVKALVILGPDLEARPSARR